MQFIAEVKTKSPFGFSSPHSWDELFDIAVRRSDIISIHTDSRWGGSFEILATARKRTNKPILAKGIHKTDDLVQRAIDLGADWVLVVGRIHPNPKCIIEPLNLEQLRSIPIDRKVVWNSRNLQNGSLKTESFQEARKVFKGWLCQASNIRTSEDIQAGADAILVGSNLVSLSQILFGGII